MSKYRYKENANTRLNYFIESYDRVFGKKFQINSLDHEVLKEVINYYESIIACMPLNVYWSDKKGETVGCNINVLKMMNVKERSELLGLTFEDLGKLGNWSKEAEQKFKLDTMEVLKTKRAKLNSEEPPIPGQAGEMISFLSSRAPLFDTHGNIIGVVGISIDITERKRMERELINAKMKAEKALKAKEEAEANLYEKSRNLQIVLNNINQKRYYLTGKYKGIYLTKREAECIVCLARGMTSKEIGTALNIKCRTVEMFLAQIKGKLNCNNKSQLIQEAIECQFLEEVRPLVVSLAKE